MPRNSCAGLNELVVSILIGDTTFKPQDEGRGADDYQDLRELLAHNHTLWSPCENLSREILRINSAGILDAFSRRLSAKYDDEMSDPEFSIDCDDDPSTDPMTLEEAISSYLKHERCEALSLAAANGDIGTIREVYELNLADFTTWYFAMLESAIAKGQEECAIQLLSLGLSSSNRNSFTISDVADFTIRLAAKYQREHVLHHAFERFGNGIIAEFDDTFWYLYFPVGPSEPNLRNLLIREAAQYGSRILQEAVSRKNWSLASKIAEQLNENKKKEVDEERKLAMDFFKTLHYANSKNRKRDDKTIAGIMWVWRNIADGNQSKLIAVEGSIQRSQISNHKIELESKCATIYKSHPRFRPHEARRIWDLLIDEPEFRKYSTMMGDN